MLCRRRLNILIIKGITYINLTTRDNPELVAFKERHKDKIWIDDSDFLQNGS